MSSIENGRARAVAEVADGPILASVEVAAPPGRVLQAPVSTRITLRHSGFAAPEVCTNTCIGWETSFERLAEILATKRTPSP
jgi:hypothetical protein